jgi:glutamate-ammonia-ligase adenylyltransferase
VQTHDVPADGRELEILARVLGYARAEHLTAALDRARDSVSDRFLSLLREPPRPPLRYAVLLSSLEQRSADLPEIVEELFGDADVSPHLLRLSRRPDGLLGGLTLERHPELSDRVLDALRSSSDPEQAARFLATFFARFSSAATYVAALAAEARSVRRLVTALGASAFVGEAIAARPDLADVVLFPEGKITAEEARRIVDQELDSFEHQAPPSTDVHERREDFIGAQRRALRRVTVAVAVADLAGELDTRETTRVLSTLADATLQNAVRYAMGGDTQGLAVIAMGKLGGGDIGYGSDLDVLFIYDDAATPEGQYAPDYYSRLAQRVIRLISEPHSVGPGYELDTRLRPSGSQGLLVTSVAAFARYHGVALEGAPVDVDRLAVSSGAAWERQALLRARPCAGDKALGARVLRVAQSAAYEGGAPLAEEVHHLRLRMERELARERPGRFDFKLGRGGLLDVEFAAQWLQMRHGSDPNVRTTDTVGALHALHLGGYLPRQTFEALRDGYVFLRRLEQRIRIVHGSGATVLDATAEGLTKLARRMGIPDSPVQSEAESLLEEYRETTELVRAAYLEILGVEDDRGATRTG